MGHKDHREKAPASVGFHVVTCSDSRSLETDESGKIIMDALERFGHKCMGRSVVRDESRVIIAEVGKAVSLEGVKAVIVNGGTGISRRDSTFEALCAVFEKRLDGFGELFRHLSFIEIGPAAMLSRAAAGTFRGAVVFSVPGSPNACRLASEKLIGPELGHVVFELGR